MSQARRQKRDQQQQLLPGLPRAVSSGWKRGVTAAGVALSTTFWTPTASAEDGPAGDIGAYLSYTFGAPVGALGWGLELRGQYGDWIRECGSTERIPFVGGVLRFGWLGWSQPRLNVGVQGGAVFGEAYAANGELAVGYRWGEQGGVETLIGGDVGASVGSMHLRFDPLRTEASVGGGLRFPPPRTDIGGCYVVGRPLRAVTGFAQLPLVHRAGPVDDYAQIDADIRDEVVGTWCQRAQTEWASVPAFVQLARQLAANSAPSELVARCLVAAEDEMRHAFFSAGIASYYGRSPLSLAPMTPETRPIAQGTAGLLRLATESWIDGCVGEGAAAACATREALSPSSAMIGEAQGAIATDEAGHAELAWDVLAWALDAGGERVREAVAVSGDARPSDESTDAGQGNPDLRRYGCLSPEERTHVAAEHRAQALERLGDLLAM